MIKIGFTGTGGTGKSTLMNELNPLWKKLGVTKLPSLMRSVLEKHNINTEKDLLDLNYNDLKKVQITGLITRLTAEEQKEYCSWVSDRTALDHLVYIFSWCGAAMFNDTLKDRFEPTVEKSLKSLDCVVYFPRRVYHNVSDGFRVDHQVHHEVVDLMIKHYLDKWGITYYTLVMPGLNQRAEEVSAYVKRINSYVNPIN